LHELAVAFVANRSAGEEPVLMRAARIAVLGLSAIASLLAPARGQELTVRDGEHRVAFQARDGLIYIQARVNGSRRTLLVDTGATFTIFTIKAVPEIDLDSAIVLNLPRGSVSASRHPVGLVLGDSDHPERHCAFRLNAAVGAFKFMNAEGVVGIDVLSRFKSVTFDFKNSVMILEDR
jgi:hypothetical protein